MVAWSAPHLFLSDKALHLTLRDPVSGLRGENCGGQPSVLLPRAGYRPSDCAVYGQDPPPILFSYESITLPPRENATIHENVATVTTIHDLRTQFY